MDIVIDFNPSDAFIFIDQSEPSVMCVFGSTLLLIYSVIGMMNMACTVPNENKRGLGGDCVLSVTDRCLQAQSENRRESKLLARIHSLTRPGNSSW